MLQDPDYLKKERKELLSKPLNFDGLGRVRPIVTRTLMSDADARRRLAEVALGAVPA